ncbi:hypothetical protein EQG41_08970 [Billgrantia azerbaijanica]|nr:hypothetical protein EQG41_08970 [Halomonas azerbaijanica]
MGPLLSLLFRRLAFLFAEVFAHFGMLAVRSFVWFKVAKFGWFLVKLGIFVFLVETFMSGIESVANGIQAAMPGMLADGIGRILPSNFYACVSAILMAKFMVFALHVKDRVLNLTGDV